jgi:hypothetical protein
VPYDTLARYLDRIINEVRGIHSVVFDISRSRPPQSCGCRNKSTSNADVLHPLRVVN